MPLKIVIIGAGVAGLVAAIALRRAGHDIVVLEKSAFAAEIGAAINLSPNALSVLAHLGFDLQRARTCRIRCTHLLHEDNLAVIRSVPSREPGNQTVHRVDLHHELLRLATTAGAELRLGEAVSGISEDGTGVILESAEEVRGDLVVAADGVHSVARDFVLQGLSGSKAVHSGLAAFRFLVETSKFHADTELRSLLDFTKAAVNIIEDKESAARADPSWVRQIVWYECRDGELQNVVGVHPSKSTAVDASEELKEAMTAEFGHFDPRIRKMITLSSDIKRWPLYIHGPLSTWVRGSVVLIGDAAHPMLPFGGQGACQAIEDGAALGLALQDESQTIARSLSRFEELRKNRVARIQILSNVKESCETSAAIVEQLGPYLDTQVPNVPMSLDERLTHARRYDVYAAYTNGS